MLLSLTYSTVIIDLGHVSHILPLMPRLQSIGLCPIMYIYAYVVLCDLSALNALGGIERLQ